MIHLPKMDSNDPYMVAQRKAISQRLDNVGKKKDARKQKMIRMAIWIVAWLIISYIVYRLLAMPFPKLLAKGLVLIGWMVFGPLYLRAKWLFE